MTTTIDPAFEEAMKREGYLVLKRMDDGSIAGLRQFMFTWGVCADMTWTGYGDRWCYENAGDAIVGLLTWNGEGDPPGPWLKQKGRNERNNPALFDVVDGIAQRKSAT